MKTTFNIPATIVCGGGALGELAAQLQRLQARCVLLVTDDFIVRSGLAPRVESDLRGGGVEVALFAGVQPDPTEANVLAGLARNRESRAEVIVALGGGSRSIARKRSRCSRQIRRRSIAPWAGTRFLTVAHPLWRSPRPLARAAK